MGAYPRRDQKWACTRRDETGAIPQKGGEEVDELDVAESEGEGVEDHPHQGAEIDYQGRQLVEKYNQSQYLAWKDSK